MSMKELKVGEEVRIRCVEDYSRIPECPKCCFYHECRPLEMRCQSYARTDGKNVHFELVEEHDMQEKPQKLFYVLPTYGDVKDNERLRDDLN